MTNQAALMTKKSFVECQPMLTALGDENRQNILLALVNTTCQTGLRVGEITSLVNLSRPAVSHHLKILREAGLIKKRQEGTMNFYAADIRTNFAKLRQLLDAVQQLQEAHDHD
ncbi:ArsR/SmtB family transcription factor [Lapidilactobacillus wuchangensis]|uniref:ArsR/SmtB family transcription factor n=1 Tax=Lapidilactobacillus wuchangensis TaxID=2486001 RepID=UPI000F788B93|nr:metalloregulator ArsR/SmtB family transcription factor [Lapidilactobacillus wuchangensis]